MDGLGIYIPSDGDSYNTEDFIQTTFEYGITRTAIAAMTEEDVLKVIKALEDVLLLFSTKGADAIPDDYLREQVKAYPEEDFKACAAKLYGTTIAVWKKIYAYKKLKGGTNGKVHGTEIHKKIEVLSECTLRHKTNRTQLRSTTSRLTKLGVMSNILPKLRYGITRTLTRVFHLAKRNSRKRSDCIRSLFAPYAILKSLYGRLQQDCYFFEMRCLALLSQY